jgi:hypothetical protein
MLTAKQVFRSLGFMAFVCVLVGLSPLAAQTNFTLTIRPFNPPSVVPSETATTTLDVSAIGSFSGTVALTCSITSAGSATFVPPCDVSPTSVTIGATGATPSVTVPTTGGTDGTSAGEYQVLITGTSGAETESSSPIFLNVGNVAQNYTLTVNKPTSPGTVTAGNGATAQILITPEAGYTGNVTLYCESITPVVTAAPECSFSPQPVPITGGAAPPATLTITTFGTITNTVAQNSPARFWPAFCFAIPGVALIGAGTRYRKNGKTRRTLLGLFLLLILTVSLLMLPSCSSTTTTSTNGLTTPKNTYTFTVSGVDATGIAPSNLTTSQATVTLTVN